MEVKERNLTVEEAKEFAKAKGTEVRNFISSSCFEAVRGKNPEEEEILGMRWLLTWKYGEQYPGGCKAKARGVILGYQDPNYAERPTSAPTPTRSGRQLFWQYCSWKKFKIRKGDVSGAFLQGKDLEEEIWCRPVKEITDELGLSEGTPMLMRKAAYGLVQAPLVWFESINEFLQELGYRQLKVEPCCWVWTDHHGIVKSIVHSHVDDLMFAGRDNCPQHEKLLEKMRQKFNWGSWEEGEFIQCGIEVKQQPDYSIELSQKKFIDDLEEVPLCRDRARWPETPATEAEKSKLRGVLGSIAWLCGQTCFIYAVDVNFLVSSIPVATVQEIIATNKLVKDIKKTREMVYKVHSFPENEEIVLACWSDAAWANRPNGKDSTAGIFVGTTTERIQDGVEVGVTAVHWRSSKIERTCRSPACAETLAALDGEDELTYLRILWNELNGKIINPRYVDEAASHVKGLLMTDARNLYDKLHRATPTVKGAEKRSSIEAISLRENLDHSKTDLHWVNGGAMLANPLTKTQEKGQFWLFLELGQRWKIVHDERFQSEKKRRKEGLTPLGECVHRDIQHNVSTSSQQPSQEKSQTGSMTEKGQ